MSEEPTVVPAERECPYCHKMVNGESKRFSMHKYHCKKKLEKPSGEKPPEQSPAKSEKPEYQPKTADIKAIVDRALAYQKEMLKAPEAFTATMSSDENMQLRKAYAPETLPRYDKKGNLLSAANGGHTHTAYIGDAKMLHQDIAKGYVPKLNEHGEYVVNQGGDILYTRPREITERIITANQMESRMRVREVTKQATEKSTVKDKDIPLANDGEVKEQELAYTGQITLKPGDV